MPILGAINDWPLWKQIVLSGVAALVWLFLLTWMFIFLNRRKTKANEAPPSASAQSGGAASVATGANSVSQAISGNHNVVVGGDIHIHVPPGAMLVPQKTKGVLSMPVSASMPLYITCNFRKTAGAIGGAYVGLKLNGVVLTDVQLVTSTTDQAEEGFAIWEVGGATPGGNRTAIMRWATKHAHGQIGSTAGGLATAITEATITGKVDDARITLGVSQFNIYALPV